MASPRYTLLLVVLCCVVVHEILIGQNLAVEAKKIDCGSKCEYRCSKASRHRRCVRTCKKCCRRCNCVPPGTSGHENVCPCYAKLRFHHGKRKCP